MESITTTRTKLSSSSRVYSASIENQTGWSIRKFAPPAATRPSRSRSAPNASPPPTRARRTMSCHRNDDPSPLTMRTHFDPTRSASGRSSHDGQPTAMYDRSAAVLTSARRRPLPIPGLGRLPPGSAGGCRCRHPRPTVRPEVRC